MYNQQATQLLFELSRPGARCARMPAPDVSERPLEEMIPAKHLASTPPPLPEVTEPEIVRHYVNLSQLNFSVDTHFYPLGSCTMKYNPKRNERLATLPGFTELHPYQDESTLQGLLELLWHLQKMLAEIAGLDAVSLQPAAGAHGELTCLLMAAAYFRQRGEQRTKVLIPDSAHGTNSASAAIAGFQAVQVASNGRGLVDLEDLRRKLDRQVGVFMITNPNTLGLFDDQIEAIARMVHDVGALLYLDGANMNAILGITRPGDFGADLMHYNPHKTFSTPHGGGGPGAGPIAVRDFLAPFLPVPLVAREQRIQESEVRSQNSGPGIRNSAPTIQDPKPETRNPNSQARYYLDYNQPLSIGRVRSFFGNTGILIRAYCYIRTHGAEGLREVAQHAVLNANYLLHQVHDVLPVPYGKRCMHEFVASARNLAKERGVKAMDIVKRLLDFAFYAPTVYFPLVVPEALMIEPTETESKRTLDAFAAALRRIVQEEPELLHQAPHTTPISRPDEVRAARQPVLRWTREADKAATHLATRQ